MYGDSINIKSPLTWGGRPLYDNSIFCPCCFYCSGSTAPFFSPVPDTKHPFFPPTPQHMVTFTGADHINISVRISNTLRLTYVTLPSFVQRQAPRAVML